LNNNKLINEKLICAFRWSLLCSLYLYFPDTPRSYHVAVSSYHDLNIRLFHQVSVFNHVMDMLHILLY